MSEKEYAIIKYSDHQDEFMVLDNPPNASFKPAIMQKQSFSLGIIDKDTEVVVSKKVD